MSSSATNYPPQEQPAPSDGEFPQMWEHYSQMVALRQRMLQAMMAYYLQKEEGIEQLYATETKMGLPHIDYLPQTTGGKNSLTRFNSVCASYNQVMDRFKSIYGLQ
jgi:hypothetical protein